MISSNQPVAREDYNTLLEERNALAGKLRLPDTFRTPAQRSLAAGRLKELNATLNRMYQERSGS